jgi:hypothetical protein
MAKSFAVMCQVFFAMTCVIGLFFAASVLRRSWYIREKKNLFTVIAPQLMAWAPMQIFYCMIAGFLPQNHNVPTFLITTSNLMSSMILGNTIPQLIVTWMEIKQKTETMKSARYQKQYWIAIGVFTLTATIASILTGINATYYFIFMRILLGIWTTYLIICCVMFFYFGINMYVLTAPYPNKSNDKSIEIGFPTSNTLENDERSDPKQCVDKRSNPKQCVDEIKIVNEIKIRSWESAVHGREIETDNKPPASPSKSKLSNDMKRNSLHKNMQRKQSGPLQADNARDDTRQAHIYVLVILITLGFLIFIPVIAFFIFYIVKTEYVEMSEWLPLFIWAFFKVMSALYTGFWGVYFWRSTTYQLNATERSESSTRNSNPN